MVDRWHDIDELFDAALEVAPGDREAFLDARAGDDPELRQAVHRLLDAHDRADRFLATEATPALAAAWEGLGGDLSFADTGLIGAELGHYRLVELISRGGMGSVYRAVRSDGEFRQDVAVKVLRRGLDTDDVLRRFLAERQILASLDHPNVARLLDGGATADGRPYLVMELVEGVPITDYCDHHRLGLDARLDLFQTVCGAVQYAHARLVIHRDLKPANILVSGDGVVKLLDFGIAKLLDAEADPALIPHTRTGMRLLTPGYASPEQLLGGPVTTATDVYELGLVLHVLLTGRPYRALEGPEQGADGRLRQVKPSVVVARAPESGAEQTPAAAAARRATTPERLVRELRGDLDTIVLKTLHRDPDRRYGSVEELRADIKRYLRGLPIEAQRDSLGYRLRKFARRNRSAVAGGVAFALLLTAYAATITVQRGSLAIERDRVRTEAATAQQVTEFLVRLFASSDPARSGGATVTARELLDSGAVRVERELSEDPEVQARIMATIGTAYSALGVYDRAEPLLRSALALNRTVHGDYHPTVIQNLADLASFRRRADFEEGLRLNAEATRIAETVHGPEHPEVARLLIDRAEWLETDDQRRHALLARALAILRQADSTQPTLLARALQADAFNRPPDQAIPRLEESLEIREVTLGPDHPDVALTLNALGLALFFVAPDSAEVLLRRSLDRTRAVYGDNHPNTLEVMNNLAALLRNHGRHADAEPIYRELLESWTSHHEADRLMQAFAAHGLGWVLAEQGKHVEAEPLLRGVVDHLAVDPERHLVTLPMARSTLGRCLALQGRLAEAEPLLLAGYEGTPGFPPTVERLVDLYDAWGRPSEAAKFRAILETVRKDLAR